MSSVHSHTILFVILLFTIICQSYATNLWTQPDGPLIIAHGTCFICPALTRPCFDTLLAFGSDVLEMDLQLTADNQLAVLHDDDLQLVCNDSRRIRDLTVAQLKEIDAAYNFNPEEGCPLRGKGYQVMTFEEVITQIPLVNPATGRPVGIELEVKPKFEEGGKEVADALLLLLDKYGKERKLYDRVIVATEWCEVTAYIAEKTTNRIVTGACEAECFPIGLAAFFAPLPLRWVHTLLYGDSPSDAIQVPPNRPIELVTKTFVNLVHATGKRLDYFVINDRSQMEAILDVGGDGIVTDRPEIAWDVFVAKGLRSKTQRAPLPANLVYFPNAVDFLWPYDCVGLLCFLLNYPLPILAAVITLIVSLVWWRCCSQKRSRK